MKPLFWTPAKEAELTRLIAEGVTRKVAAKSLGNTINAIKNRCVLLGIKSIKPQGTHQKVISYHSIWSDDKIVKIRFLMSEGKTSTEAAQILGTSRNAVIGKCARLKIDIAQRHGKENKDHKPNRLYNQPVKEIYKRSVVKLSDYPSYNQCSFPVGDLDSEDFKFCKESLTDHTVYCNHHHSICHTGKTALGMKLKCTS